MSEDRPKKDVLVYIQRDLEAIKHTLDRYLKPYKADLKQLREENLSLRENARAKEGEVEAVMRVVARKHPELVDELLAALVDPERRGWKKFRANWRYRLGLE
jgi:hypothetical protein